MIDIYDFLNKPGTLRALDEETFQSILPSLAEQLSNVDYHYFYTEKELKQDWDKLCAYRNGDFFTAAQTRPGMKLCEYFFPNFFDIVNSKGQGFKNYWNSEDLKKVITWNRKSHSTPYLSELRRGISFCYGLTKNTMYRPHLAKIICDYYKPNVVFDPCAGWGGRMLGVVAAGAKYIGVEPNTKTYENLKKLSNFLGIENKVTIFNECVENFDYNSIQYDLVLTSPPYYNLEIYCDENTQSEIKFPSYQDWLLQWLEPLIVNTGKNCDTICWNVANVGKMKLQDELFSITEKNGWKEDKIFGIGSSARQANQNELKNKKNLDRTICFKK